MVKQPSNKPWPGSAPAHWPMPYFDDGNVGAVYLN
jgi:hypothetical protein